MPEDASDYRMDTSHGADNWVERAESEQQTLAEYRDSPGYKAMLDVLDAEMRDTWRLWLRTDNAEEAEEMRLRARTIQHIITVFDRKTGEKDRMAEMERQWRLMNTDTTRAQDLLARAPKQR